MTKYSYRLLSVKKIENKNFENLKMAIKNKKSILTKIEY